MSLQLFHWEHHLLALAQEALDSHQQAEPGETATRAPLDEAYDHCDEVTYVHSRTFYLASNLLRGDQRRAIRALYAFCRVTDDLVDRARGNGRVDLEAWRRQTTDPDLDPKLVSHDETSTNRKARKWKSARKDNGSTPETFVVNNDQVALAWADARSRYQIPLRYAEQLIDGVSCDLDQNSYDTFRDLATYCYGVASTVGLMSMHIIGFQGTEALPYAIRLGVALQLTNILRDVGEDLQNGRVYLPREELRAFDLTQEDLHAGQVTRRWRSFMRFQLDRTRQLYAQALPGVRLLDPSGRFAIGAAAELYSGILDDIEKNDYNVFRRRASLSKWEKLRLLPGIWWRTNVSGYPVVD